jgi:putative endonuclease
MPESKQPAEAGGKRQIRGTSAMDYQFWVYIVGSSSGTLYVGFTNDIHRRIFEHKSGEFEGFASKCGCNRLLYSQKFDNVFKAIAREKQLKGWRREKKIKLIESMNPRWQDLAETWGEKMLFANQAIRDQKD